MIHVTWCRTQYKLPSRSESLMQKTVLSHLLTPNRSTNGSGVLTKPPGGWTDPAMGALFGEDVHLSTKRTRSLSTGAIAGITVAVVFAVIALLTGGTFYWYRQRERRRHQDGGSHQTQGSQQNQGTQQDQRSQHGNRRSQADAGMSHWAVPDRARPAPSSNTN